MNNKYTFQETTVDNYYSLSQYQRILEFDNLDKFWLLEIAGKSYGFAINSKIMIEPLIYFFSNEEVVFIGIHNKVVIFSANGDMELLTSLWDSFSCVEKVNLGYLIITETTLLKINQESFSVDRLITLPDVIKEYQIEGNVIKVEGITGEIFNQRL